MTGAEPDGASVAGGSGGGAAGGIGAPDPVRDEIVAARLAGIRARIAETGRDPASVTVVAVTKGLGAGAIVAARRAGLLDVGENYAQEMLAKAAEVMTAAPPTAAGLPQVRWHFLGAIQRRKVRQLAPLVGVWESVARVEEGEEITRRAPGATVYVEVNVTGAEGRQGCGWDDAPALVARLRDLDLDVRGVMGVGAVGDPRPGFRRLAALAAGMALPEVSMGMTDDYAVAVEEGATAIRIGRGLFGSRPAARQVRR